MERNEDKTDVVSKEEKELQEHLVTTDTGSIYLTWKRRRNRDHGIAVPMPVILAPLMQ